MIARKMAQIDHQVDENASQSSMRDSVGIALVNPESSSTNGAENGIVNPNHVAQVGTLCFLIIYLFLVCFSCMF